MGTAASHFAAAAATDRGRKRPGNEDAFGFSVGDGVYVVCDGMGGAAAGEVASALAVDEALSRLCSRDRTQPLPEVIGEAVAAANHAIFSRSQRNYKLNGMGTTLVGMVTQEQRIWIVNVGDSRCYRLRNKAISQITVDHSLVDEQVRLGRMTADEALRSPLRNVITRALGTQSKITPDLFELEVERGDLFLLCSDGLTREVADAEIETLLNLDISLDERCSRLVEAAKEAGGNDNITCIVAYAEN